MDVVLIGASSKPERHAYQAMKLLLEKGHRVYPVHPRLAEAENDILEKQAQESGIETVQGCTLVMLKTNQF